MVVNRLRPAKVVNKSVQSCKLATKGFLSLSISRGLCISNVINRDYRSWNKSMAVALYFELMSKLEFYIR